MKSVYFKTISIQNFLSVGEEKVFVEFQDGINLITGRNLDKPDRRNGIGKSTIADALYFVIFGDTLRDIKKDLIVNNITGGTTQITLEFDIDLNGVVDSYKLTRTLNPSKVYIQHNGIDTTRDTLINTNKYISDILSATPSVFQNCVIMTVNNAVPFMAKSKVEKRKFIEDIFGLEVFSNMLSVLRAEYNDTKKQCDIENAKIEEVKNAINTYKQQQQRVLETRVYKLAVYNERKTENVNQKNKIFEQLSTLSEYDVDGVESKLLKLSAGVVTCDERITDSVTSLTEIKTKISFLESTYKKLGTTDHECPVCLRELKDHDINHINNEKEKMVQEISDLKSRFAEFSTIVLDLKGKKELINKSIKINEQLIVKHQLQEQSKNSLLEKLDQIERWQESLVNDIEQVSTSTTEFDTIINDTTARFNELVKIIDEFNTKFSLLDVVKYVVSEEGVKSYIVNKLLSLLNSRLAYYLSKLDSNAVCSFNEFFEEEIVNEKNKICSYFNFSGAERKGVDLACLFTFSDLRRLQGGVQYNIAIYDEILDSSVDEKGLEYVTDVLKERANKFGEKIYIISHRKESLKAVTGEVVFLEKRDGITTRVDFVENQM